MIIAIKSGSLFTHTGSTTFFTFKTLNYCDNYGRDGNIKATEPLLEVTFDFSFFQNEGVGIFFMI